ncbi:hypothetical protein BOX15_Mlig018394g1 [Macrostomum lignano]|uniref:Cleavage inducing molecular chaperone Jiv domain-containing protein n=2 Tax=Macrostomum lignano TaxID=282301 RepID=A0A267FNC0_9PLAT|nr:hypothetical protein BOX15_Mlig024711g1 [Macrostomum lignano]PAA86178.1 hypothetical protein BOX15_Mlig018394g1 [Macrostomum lignano]
MAQLAADLQLAVHRLPCARCSGRHLWLPTDLSPQAARYCSACRVRHPAQDGDLWAESRLLGLRRVFLACQDGRVCQVNELARCQAELFAKLQPDCHRCQLRRAEAAPPYRFVYRK